jgi:predicted DNA-binding transcriptional regulator AlpA
MKTPAFSVLRAPRVLPIWHAILEDLGHPPVRAVARVLGVSARTVYRWNRTGRAPRSACLALFWMTRWGRSEIDCQLHNDAVAMAGLARVHAERADRLEVQLAHVLALNEHGAANLPVYRTP